MTQPDRKTITPQWWHAITTALILTLISSIWVESDAYRYALGIILLGTMVYYLRVEVWQPDRIRVGPVGLIALCWGIYILARYVLVALAQDNWSLGTAEGIYILPAIYITTGYGIFLMRPDPRWLMTSFIIVTSLVLAGGFGAVTANLRSATNAVFANNTIHMSFGLGFALTMHLHFLLYYRKQLRDLTLVPWLSYGLCVLNAALCLTYIILLNSKGVWLAVGFMLAVMVVLTLIGPNRLNRRNLFISAVTLFIISFAVVLTFSRLERVAGRTADSAMALSHDMVLDGVGPALVNAAESQSVPRSMRTRLQLIVDSLSLIEEKPVLGHGPGWLARWDERQYQQHDFINLHNSYLEVLVRYGGMGMAFYALMFSWALYQIAHAQREKLVGTAAMPIAMAMLVYFAVGAATNSHIRLAQGESFMLVFVAYGSYCYALRQRAQTIIVRTFI
ncbi:MAG: O-antigen ligase family protein [Ahrensia sp.]